MHTIYSMEHLSENRVRYSAVEQVALFGCKSGIVCNILSHKLKEQPLEPEKDCYKWEVDIRDGLPKVRQSGIKGLVINFKPNSARNNLSLY